MNFSFTDTARQFTSSETHLPEYVANTERWILWKKQSRDGKVTKVPCDKQAHAVSVNDEGNYLSLEDAFTAYENDARFDGVGWVLSSDDDVVGIDFDDVVSEDGTVSQQAWEIVQELDSWTEFSPSGTGLHTLVRGELADDLKQQGALDDGDIEMYEESRFFTMTANAVDTLPQTIEHADIPSIQADVLGERESVLTGELVDDDSLDSDVSASPQDVYERASASSEKFERLWNCRTTHDESDGDQALLAQLAFWCKGDIRLMEDCMRTSKRNRTKFDRKATSNGKSYLRHSAEKAVKFNSGRYSGDY